MSDSKLKILEEPWYKKGLRFQCTECGKCCTGSPGYVWISAEEIEEMISFLQIPKDEFYRRFLRQVGEKWALKERVHDYSCIFLKDNQCRVYPCRPKQCQTFPWWKENLKSKKVWEEQNSYCEGINHPQGKLFSYEEIHKNMN